MLTITQRPKGRSLKTITGRAFQREKRKCKGPDTGVYLTCSKLKEENIPGPRKGWKAYRKLRPEKQPGA